MPVRPREAPINITLVPADTQRTVEQIFHDAALWEVSDYRERVKRGRMSLEAKWREAIPWVAANKLNTVDGLERRAIVELFKAHPDTAAPYLVAALNSSDRGTRRTVISTLAEMKYRAAAGALMAKLADSSFAFLRPTMLTALGELGDKSATETAVRFSSSSVERERIGATVCLGKLSDPQGYAAIYARLSDSLYTVSSAAIIALAAQGPQAVPFLSRQQVSEPLLLAVARMAARWRGVDSLKAGVPKLAPLVGRALGSSEPRVQAAALLAAAQVLKKAEVTALTKRYATATDPVIRARLKQVEKTLR
jgi:HEAT repeat protein